VEARVHEGPSQDEASHLVNVAEEGVIPIRAVQGDLAHKRNTSSTEALCVEPCGGPRGRAVSYERGTPIRLQGWTREFKLPWREAGSLNHHDEIVDSD
jgi:hypothetical protein